MLGSISGASRASYILCCGFHQPRSAKHTVISFWGHRFLSCLPKGAQKGRGGELRNESTLYSHTVLPRTITVILLTLDSLCCTCASFKIKFMTIMVLLCFVCLNYYAGSCHSSFSVTHASVRWSGFKYTAWSPAVEGMQRIYVFVWIG